MMLAWCSTAQDTVKMNDQWYLYFRPDCYTFDRWHGYYGPSVRSYWYPFNPFPYNPYTQELFREYDSLDWYYVQKYYHPKDEGVVIYGIALTAENLPIDRNLSPYLGLYNHGHDVAAYNYTRVINLVDSLNISDMRKECVFKYELVDTTPVESRYVTCQEFYFQHPYHIDSLTERFYVGIIWPKERKIPYGEMTESWNVTAKFHPTFIIPRANILAPDAERCVNSYALLGPPNEAVIGYYYTDSLLICPFLPPTFGPVFPIIGLRCSAPRVRLAERGDSSATVGWWAAEPGVLYQASIGAYGSLPDSGMIVTTADTFYTFSCLEPEALNSVWARKGCRYTTASYDTIVWSDWSQPVSFRAFAAPAEGILEAGGEAFTLSPNPARGTVQVALPAAAVGGRLSLCDLAGRELEALSVTATTLTLDVGQRPAGVYLVKLVTPSGVSSRRLVVE